jgi:hypothetical protein
MATGISTTKPVVFKLLVSIGTIFLVGFELPPDSCYKQNLEYLGYQQVAKNTQI